MRQEIINKLNEIEKKEDVKIIYAVESGSRAWGFESIDSDYDVRFIYVRDKNEYLCLEEKSDVIPVSYTHLPSPRDKRQSRMPSSA